MTEQLTDTKLKQANVVRSSELFKESSDPMRLRNFLCFDPTRVGEEPSNLRKSIIVLRGQEAVLRGNLHVVADGKRTLPMIRRTGKYAPSMIVPELGGLTTVEDEQRYGNDFIDLKATLEEFARAIARLRYSYSRTNGGAEDFRKPIKEAIEQLDLLQTGGDDESVVDTLVELSTRNEDELAKVIAEFINKSKVKGAAAGISIQKLRHKVCSEVISQNGNATAIEREIRLALDVLLRCDVHFNRHRESIEKSKTLYKNLDDIKHLVIQGCGDLSMNLWHVGCVVDSAARLIHVPEEPLDVQEYRCLISWKSTGTESKKEGKDLRGRLEVEGKNSLEKRETFTIWKKGKEKDEPTLSIGRVRFNQYSTGEDKVRLVLSDGKSENIKEHINFAVFGKPVVWKGIVLDAREVARYCADLRHLIKTPNLNPESPKNESTKETAAFDQAFEKAKEGVHDNISRFFDDKEKERLHKAYFKKPRYLFGIRSESDVWLGEHAFLSDPELLKVACDSPVEIELSELGAPLTWVTVRMLMETHKLKMHRDMVKEPGDFTWNMDDETNPKLVWYPKRACYPCTMIGIGSLGRRQTTDQDLFLLAWGHKFDEDQQYTIIDCAQYLRDLGAHSVLLMDEGRDVFQSYFESYNQLKEACEGEVPAASQVPRDRTRIRASLAFWVRETFEN